MKKSGSFAVAVQWLYFTPKQQKNKHSRFLESAYSTLSCDYKIDEIFLRSFPCILNKEKSL